MCHFSSWGERFDERRRELFLDLWRRFIFCLRREIQIYLIIRSPLRVWDSNGQTWTIYWLQVSYRHFRSPLSSIDYQKVYSFCIVCLHFIFWCRIQIEWYSYQLNRSGEGNDKIGNRNQRRSQYHPHPKCVDPHHWFEFIFVASVLPARKIDVLWVYHQWLRRLHWFDRIYRTRIEYWSHSIFKSCGNYLETWILKCHHHT